MPPACSPSRSSGRRWSRRVVEGTGAGTGVLDPLGADLEAGPGQYAQLLRALSASLVDCLGTPRSG